MFPFECAALKKMECALRQHIHGCILFFTPYSDNFCMVQKESRFSFCHFVIVLS